jgi:hypothetical protein
MGDEVLIGIEPPPTAPPRSGKVLGLAAGLIVLVAAGAWLVGTSRDTSPPSTTMAPFPDQTFPRPLTTTTGGPTTTASLEDRLQRARTFWTTMGTGDAAGALAAVAEPAAAAGDLIAFVAAFETGFTVGDCRELADDAVECLVVVPDGALRTVGTGTADEVLRVADDGGFDVPSPVGSAAARLSLYALEAHTEEVRAACPLTGSPPVLHLAIVGSPTAGCGAYLAGLIPEYLTSLGLPSGAPAVG